MMALVFMLQTLVPTWALAEVSVRCVGAPAASAPCMKVVLPVGHDATSHFKCADMSCCRNAASLMKACKMAMSGDPGMTMQRQANTAALSAPKCLISIKPLTSPQSAATNMHRWLLKAAPALAPPAITHKIASPTALSNKVARRQTIPLLPTFSMASHGLRAPPLA